MSDKTETIATGHLLVRRRSMSCLFSGWVGEAFNMSLLRYYYWVQSTCLAFMPLLLLVMMLIAYNDIVSLKDVVQGFESRAFM